MSLAERIENAPVLNKAMAFWPGILVCSLIAFAAEFLSEHYGAPSMLMALLLGMTLHFLVADGGRSMAGVAFSSKTILRLGVALLGARISFDIFAELGFTVVGLVSTALVATFGAGYLFSRLLGRGWRLALLTAGSVAICGASAAMAIAAVLPRNEYSERNLSFTVFGVTLLSTVVMILYPIVARLVGLNELATGVFLGGSIHDVAQVVGAGFSVSDFVGETAATVKLIRVSLMAPVVLTMILAFRLFIPEVATAAKRPPLLPGFIVGFLVLALFNSFGLLPEQVQAAAWVLSKWAMLIAIAAVGMKTEISGIVGMPMQSIVLIIADTLFIGGFVLAGVSWLL